MELNGYDQQENVFLLRVEGTETHLIRRSFRDFQGIDRLCAAHYRSSHDGPNPPTPIKRFPSRRFRKLMEMSWQKGDTTMGWRRELQKNVVACEKWIHHTLSMLSTSERTVFVVDAAYHKYNQQRVEKRCVTQRARDLQQYFTSADVIKTLISRMVKWLATRGMTITDKRLVWLEPSCGDGRWVNALIHAGVHRVLAYEIDEDVGRLAQAQIEQATQGRVSCHASVSIGDFLLSTPPLLSKNTVEHPFVIAIGNPPFGVRGEAAENERPLDLILQFIIHVAHTWHGTVIAFLVPMRCTRRVFIDTVLCALNHGEKSKPWLLEDLYLLEDSKFDFYTTSKQVGQPSGFLILTKNFVIPE